MATRQETQNKRRRMRESIVESCRTGSVQPGDVIPPLRDLARQFGLSVNLAGEVVQSLVAEGVLHSRPGAGTTIGNPLPASGGTYLFLAPEGAPADYIASSFVGVAQRGFETTIAALGGACITLEAGRARQYSSAGQLPPLSGVFSTDSRSLEKFIYPADIARACYGEPGSPEISVRELVGDLVHFDNLNGGRQATSHLLATGHKRIAYLGLHVPEVPGEFLWSAQREAGWRESMDQSQLSVANLAFHPTNEPSTSGQAKSPISNELAQMEAAGEAATPLVLLIRDHAVTAVVTANYFAARALFKSLQDGLVPTALWPAVVCFDSPSGMDNDVVSALNLSWDEIGKAGAQLLWERNVGRLVGPPAVRLVPMQLIPRLTCRRDWADASRSLIPGTEALAGSLEDSELEAASIS